MYNKLQEYYKRLSKQSWLRSLLYGLTVGFSAMSIASLALLRTEENYFWIPILIGVGVTAATTVGLYFLRFKPSEKNVVRKVDDLGLKERILTMKAFENDNSYIAQRQRADALAALGTVNAKLLSVAVNTSLIITASVCALGGTGLTVITANPAIRQELQETIDQIVEEPPIEYEVTYEAGEGGLIDGDMFQIILHGGDGEGVMAEAEEEYIFVEWSDGVKTPYRVDKNVTSSFTVTAIFQYSENSDEEDGEGEGEEPSDKPGEEEEGEPQPSDKPGDPTDEPPSDEQQAGGRYEPQNQIRDGETYYGDEYEDAFNEAMEEVSQDGDLEDGQKDIIGDYFDAIQH